MKNKSVLTNKPSTEKKTKKRAPIDTQNQMAENLTGIVAENVHRLRADKDLSLEKLAGLSGVSKAMLSQIEQARSAPSINVLWKIARALDVPFAALIGKREEAQSHLLRKTEMKTLSSHDGSFVSKALFPLDSPRRVEFYQLSLRPQCIEKAVPHPPGTTENIVVAQGMLEIEVDGKYHILHEGDSIYFEADVQHVYKNISEQETLLYLVMTYAEKRV